MSFHDDDLSNLRSAHRPVLIDALLPGRPGPRTESFYALWGKPFVDIVLILLAAPIILTIVLISAALVALDGHNPFYTQERVGKDGRVFHIFKLRSMVPNADALLAEHLARDPAAKLEWAQTQKLRHDPRITRIGRIIRKASIDEMPQFLNVLKGDMSLVGPRPFMVSQRPLYFGRQYFDLKPGLSGLWQISTRNDSEFVARVQFDELYARQLSFGLDLRIMARTVAAMVRGTGC